MKQFTKKELILLLENNNKTQPKAKYSNNILLSMLKNASDNFTATLETTRGQFSINRGSLCECLLKHFVMKQENTIKSVNGADLNTLEVVDTYGLPRAKDIEVKYTTSFSPASEMRHSTEYVLLISSLGAHLIKSDKVIKTDSGKININNQRAKDLIELTKLKKVLGL